ncbi:MAG: crotonase/enoyl-CoA hydratase family protein [Pseudomonadota bacterium]
MTDLPESDVFEISRDGAVAEIRMNRPDKANGMNAAFWTDLPRLVRALDGDMSVRALVLTGAGKNFTGGMDLAAFQPIMGILQAEPGRGAYALRRLIVDLQASFTALEETRLPVIAAIHGACIGGGIDMITACDIRLASREAVFSIEEINIGMTADVGTLQRLPKLIAPGIVRELALTGRRFSAEEAAGWGLVNAVSDDPEALRDAAFEMAHQIAAKTPLAVAGTKQALIYARDHPVADGLDQIATWNGGMLRPEDLMGAIQAKMAKKEAAFADLIETVGLSG